MMESLQEIYGLRYDFFHRHGLMMKLHREGGIYAEELSVLQLRMLESNTIPRLLTLEVQETDFQISLLYNLNSKRMLSQVIKAEGLDRAQLFKLMYAIASTLDQSGNYMLNEAQYLLMDHFIFIGSEITDVYLTYLPFQELVGGISLHEQIQSLLKLLIEKVKPEEREGFDQLLNASGVNFSLTSFKQALLDRMGETQRKKPVHLVSRLGREELLRENPVSNPVHHVISPSGTRIQPPLISSPVDVNQEASMPNLPLPGPVFSQRAELGPSGIDEEFQPYLLTQRNKLLVLIAIVIAVAFIWKSYLEHPQEAFLYTASGASLLLLDIWFVLSFIGLPRKNKTDDQEQSRLMSNWLAQSQPSFPSEKPIQEPKSRVNIQDYYSNLPKLTTLLSAAPSKATVFLGNQHGGEHASASRVPLIEVNKEGARQRIPIKGNTFRIGRGETEADYAENEAGISRLHAEIYKAVEGYGVKDLGSKNGTFLNEEPLVPYQYYPIKEGDTIRIVRTEFRIIV